MRNIGLACAEKFAALDVVLAVKLLVDRVSSIVSPAASLDKSVAILRKEMNNGVPHRKQEDVDAERVGKG